MYDEKVELAFSSQSRILPATRSAIRFHDSECDRLAAEKRLLTEELQRTPASDTKHRSELEKALRKNRFEKKELDIGWSNSSIRRRLKVGIASNAAMSKEGYEVRHLVLVSAQDLQRLHDPDESRAGDEEQNKVTGYAAKFNSNSVDLGGFIERIAPGAFSEALKNSDVKGLVNHDRNLLFARTKSKTLRLYEDRIGLKFYADLLPDDVFCQGLVSRVARGDWNQCSFAFTIKEDKWKYSRKPGEKDLRTILKRKELFDVSVVTYPAYPDTSVQVLQEDRAASEEEVARRQAELVKRHERERQYKELGCIIDRCKLSKKRALEKNYRKVCRISARCKIA